MTMTPVTYYQEKTPKVSISPFWRAFLHLIAAGKSAIGGAGAGIAVLGIVNLCILLSASNHIFGLQEGILKILASMGALVGGVTGWIRNRP